MASSQERTGPLSGYRIIEIAGIGPGPFAAMMLADMGAEVIRVERAQSVRGPAPDTAHWDVLLRGRKNIAIDLKNPQGVEALLQLVEKADALIEGFRPGVMERLGIGPDVCAQRNPKLVFGRMTGWGQEGPYAPLAGHDINYIALAGSLAHFARAAVECSLHMAWCVHCLKHKKAARAKWSTPQWSMAQQHS
jgi:alpha-methylacyl-CoA racemase